MADALSDVYVRLKDLKGESTDDAHPGKDGWIQIKSFNFGFGMKDSAIDGSTATSGANSSTGSAGSSGRGGTNPRGSGPGSGDDSPLDFHPVTFTKACDLSSSKLLKDKCHEGAPLEELELVACRYGGNDDQNLKIPFLQLIFKNVHIGSISLNLGQDELPSETITFKYDIVEMATIWTDNETGSRLTSDPKRCRWDNSKHNNKDQPA
jgi:type VI protein secretion system component Hcp